MGQLFTSLVINLILRNGDQMGRCVILLIEVRMTIQK